MTSFERLPKNAYIHENSATACKHRGSGGTDKILEDSGVEPCFKIQSSSSRPFIKNRRRRGAFCPPAMKGNSSAMSQHLIVACLKKSDQHSIDVTNLQDEDVVRAENKSGS